MDSLQGISAASLSPKTASSQDESRFKVIIVGGGVGGLTLAHCLDKAGIDFVVLDKHPIAPAWGASITIHPSSSRILDQLGLLGYLDEMCTPMHNFFNRTPDGRDYLSGPFFDAIRKRAGYLTYTLERRKFLQLLHDRLPDRACRVIPNARVVSINHVESPVVSPSSQAGRGSPLKIIQVILEDGTSHTGNLVVGADGVYSTVRAHMWSVADNLAATTGIANPIPLNKRASRVKTEYYGLTGITPMTAEFKAALGDTDMTSVSGCRQPVNIIGDTNLNLTESPYSMLFLTQPDAIYWIVQFKQAPPAVRDTGSGGDEQRIKFTDQDAELAAQHFASCKIANHSSITFGDIWKSRIRGHLVPLQEGNYNQFYLPGCNSAMVLLGDAAHKVTTNAAWGGNMAIEDAAVLANELVRMLHTTSANTEADSLDAALERYQRLRLPRVKELVWQSWLLTRLQAWDGWGMWVMQRVILPMIGIEIMSSQIAKTCVEAPKLTYLDDPTCGLGLGEKRGTLQWKDWDETARCMPVLERKAGNGMSPIDGLDRARRGVYGPLVMVLLSLLVVYVAMI